VVGPHGARRSDRLDKGTLTGGSIRARMAARSGIEVRLTGWGSDFANPDQLEHASASGIDPSKEVSNADFHLTLTTAYGSRIRSIVLKNEHDASRRPI